MGRERQKHKNRSSRSKVVRKPKSKKQILSNSIIAANWDKSQTLAQNYQRLGLTRRLNKNTGGVQRTVKDIEKERELEDGEGGLFGGNEADVLKIGGGSRKRAEKVELKEARIERDPVTGNILRVIDGDQSSRRKLLNDPLNELDSDSDLEQPEERFDQHNRLQHSDKSNGSKTETVRALELQSQRPEKKYVRRQTEGEQTFIAELVAKYGDDYEKMARDIKINYMQRSAGDLKRRVKKWRDAGGVVE